MTNKKEGTTDVFEKKTIQDQSGKKRKKERNKTRKEAITDPSQRSNEGQIRSIA